jgi:cation diffusion facilitator family transporter
VATGKDAVKVAIVVNGIIAAMKLVGAILSGSASMWAEFKHSLGDWANGFFLWVGIHQSEKPADEKYQFGYGKRAFYWAFLASLGMLLIGGVLSIYGGILKIQHPEPLEHISLNLIILGLSIIFEIYSLYQATLAVCLEGGQPTKGLKAFPIAFRLLSSSPPSTRFIFLEDTAALLGLIMAAGAIGVSFATGSTFYDGLASIIIGLLLFYIGFISAKENTASILGEAADDQLVWEVGHFIYQMPEVRDINKIKSMCVGPEKFLFFIMIEAREDLQLKDIDDLALDVKLKIQANFPAVEFAHIVAIADDKNDDWVVQREQLQKKTTN